MLLYTIFTELEMEALTTDIDRVPREGDWQVCTEVHRIR